MIFKVPSNQIILWSYYSNFSFIAMNMYFTWECKGKYENEASTYIFRLLFMKNKTLLFLMLMYIYINIYI